MTSKVEKDPTIADKAKEDLKKVIKKVLEEKYGRGIIPVNDGPSAPIFRIEYVEGKLIILLNADHGFYEYVYEPATGSPYAYPLLDLALYVLAEVRKEIGEDHEYLFNEIMNRFSKGYAVMLNQKEFSEVLAEARPEE